MCSSDLIPEGVGDFGFGGLIFLISKAYKNGFNIGTIPYASACPQKQRGEDNADYRKKQLEGNVKGFGLGL